MIYKPVLHKRDFVRRFIAGEFGNKTRNWSRLKDWYADAGTFRQDSLFHIRSRTPGQLTYYNTTEANVPTQWHNVDGDYGGWYIAEMAPHHAGTLQGEFVVEPLFQVPYLLYTFEKLPMRDALRASRYEATGIMAVSLLKANMCANSYDWMQTLLERYPGHVIEFSCFNRPLGTLPGFNTLFWEVRNF